MWPLPRCLFAQLIFRYSVVEEERKKFMFGDSEVSLLQKSLKDLAIIRFAFLKILFIFLK